MSGNLSVTVSSVHCYNNSYSTGISDRLSGLFISNGHGVV